MKNKKKFFFVFFSTFLEEMWSIFFIHIGSPQKTVGDGVQVLSFRSVEKNLLSEKTGKISFFKKNAFFSFLLFAEKMMFY